MFPALIQRRLGLALLFLLAVSLVIPQWLSAQPPAESVDAEPPALDAPSTLSDYLEFAAWNHPGLEAAFQRFQASFETIEQVQTLPDPKLSYAYFLETVETRVGPQRQKIGVSQTLPWLCPNCACAATWHSASVPTTPTSILKPVLGSGRERCCAASAAQFNS